jgi:large subunit ribosomal protein L32
LASTPKSSRVETILPVDTPKAISYPPGPNYAPGAVDPLWDRPGYDSANRSCRQELTMLPVQKKSKSRKGHRRSHHALKPINYVRCPQCGTSKLPHAACANCGYVNAKVSIPASNDEA